MKRRPSLERLETRELLSAAPPSAADFTYLGAQSLPVNQTGWESGLAYRPATDTFFTIGHAGHAPYDLEEIKIPATGPATLVKDWGPIDPTGELGGGGQFRMTGLLWDSGKLWLSWGDYYNADHTNDPVIAYVTFGGGKLHLHGPWGVPDNVGSDNIRGGLQLAPAELQAITGQRFITFAGTGNTGQDESWGPSLSSFAGPAALPEGSQTPAEKLTHWPMLHTTTDNPNGGRDFFNWYSDFPRMPGDSVTVIKGNDNVDPPAQLTSHYNVLITNSTFVEGDGVFAGAWIKEPGIDGLVYFGRESEGYSWYGNYNAHDDSSPQGIAYGNDFQSIAHPGQPLEDVVRSRGDHADQWNWTVDFVSAGSVLDTARKVSAGTAVKSDLEQQPTSIANLASLGGSVPLPYGQGSNVSGCYFDQESGTLYLLEAYGRILEWHVGAAKQTVLVSDTPHETTASTLVEAPVKLNALVPAAVDLVMSETEGEV